MHTIEISTEEAVHIDQLLWAWHFEFDKDGVDPVNGDLHDKLRKLLEQFTPEELQPHLESYDRRCRYE